MGLGPSWVTNLLIQAAAQAAQASGIAGLGTGPFRPPQWSQPQLTSITVTTPGLPAATVSSSDSLSGTSSSTTQPATQGSSTTYFFDAVFRVEHRLRRTFTKHPVQTGASLVDHSYDEPNVIILDIGMSDAMAVFTPGQYTGNPSKSVSAFQTFVQIKSSGVPLTLNTKLNTYYNMGITDIRAADTRETQYALRAEIVFEQIIVAQTSSGTSQVANSARPSETNSTSLGSANVTPAPSTLPAGSLPGQ
jgi:hypothetical protein